MSRIPDREGCIRRIEGQIETVKLWAQYHMAMATTGAAKFRKVSQGREPTEEEKAEGRVVGWRPLEDDEKIFSSLQTAKQHIHNLTNLYDARDAIMEDNPEALQEIQLRP